MAKSINFEYALNINELFNDFCLAYTEENRNLENFTHFLEINGFSTTHAKEIFDYCVNPTENALILNKDSVKIRKTHPKRDAFIKKVLIPAALVGAGIGAGVGAILGSGLIGGSVVLGIIPVSGTPGLTMIATSIVGALAGLIATPIGFKVKKALTIAHYKLWYKNAKTNLKDYTSGVELESLHITSLMNKISNTKRKILETENGSKFSAPFRFAKKHYLNIINRNRIHHLEDYTKDLVKMFRILENNKFEGQAEQIKPIYELLKQIDNFVANDVLESKLYAMLTCDEKSSHKHKSTIENVDIFATLKMYIDALTDSKTINSKETNTQAKKNSKNIANKKAKATEIINGERLISKLVAKYESDLTTTNPPIGSGLVFEFDGETLENVVVEEEPIIEEEVVILEETEVEDPVVEESVVEEETVAEETVVEEDIVVEEDVVVEEIVVEEEPAETPIVEEEFIIPEIVPEEISNPTPKTIGKLVAKTTQRLIYETRPITNDGAIVGTTLKIKANGSTEKVEIRYMSSKKQIRVKITDENNVVAQRYIPLKDSTIPPIDQMNDILRQVAEDKHIHNVDDLIIC